MQSTSCILYREIDIEIYVYNLLTASYSCAHEKLDTILLFWVILCPGTRLETA